MKIFKRYILSLVLICLQACNSNNSNSTNLKEQQPVVTKINALKIATKTVESSKVNGHWLAAKNYKVIDSRDINNKIKAYEVGVFDKKNRPLGYLIVPVYEGHGIVSKFNYEGLAPSALLESQYEKLWKNMLSTKKITVNEKKLIGSHDGIFALAIKVNSNKENIKDAQKLGDYYIFTLYPIPDLKRAIGLEKQSSHSKSIPKVLNSTAEKRLLKEERAIRQVLLK